MKVGIFVVSYNAVNHLISTLKRIPIEVEEIFVVDDSSDDNSYYAALGYKHEHNIQNLVVRRNEKNLGYGGNQKIGYQYAIERGFDLVVLLHGDGQYAPEVLPQMLKPFENKETDLVLGSRMFGGALKGGMPLYKFVGNKILTFIQNSLTGLGLSEYHSGYRAYRVEALKNIPFKEFTDSWHFDTQMILGFWKRGSKIVEVPIPTYYGDEISRVNGIPYAIHCVWETFKASR